MYRVTEVFLCQEERVASVSTQLELSVVEEGLREALDAAKSSVTTTHGAIENIATTETSLDNKIEKRQQDLERNHKRLQMLKKVRLAHSATLSQLANKVYMYRCTVIHILFYIPSVGAWLVNTGLGYHSV